MREKFVKGTNILLAVGMAISPLLPRPILAEQKVSGDNDCKTLGSVRTDGKYWNPMIGKFSNVPWFKDVRDPDPRNKNIPLQSENRARKRCGLPPLKIVDLSNKNPMVDLSQNPPRVRGMKFVGYLCDPPECGSGTPLYTTDK
jgi:hypothetical protein